MLKIFIFFIRVFFTSKKYRVKYLITGILLSRIELPVLVLSIGSIDEARRHSTDGVFIFSLHMCVLITIVFFFDQWVILLRLEHHVKLKNLLILPYIGLH
jgi:hypothetical protein